MGLLPALVRLTKNATEASKRKKSAPVGRLPPDGPGKGPERPGAEAPHKFSAEDEALIKEFRSAPLKSHVDAPGFHSEYKESVTNFFSTREQSDLERLAAFFLRHSQHAQELNEAGIKEVARRLAEQVGVSHERAPLQGGLTVVPMDRVRYYLRSARIPPGSPAHNAIESSMRLSPEISDILAYGYRKTIDEVKSNPAFLKK